MRAREFHLVQINIARMKAPLDDPLMADFVAQIEQVDAVAEASPGFVWRYIDDGGGQSFRRTHFGQHVGLGNSGSTPELRF